MSFQKIEKFAKFLKFNYISGDFNEGQIIINDKFTSQVNSSSEDTKIRDLTHELAHFILASKFDYRKRNFGLDLPGFGKTKKESELDSMCCVLGCMLMNYFGCDSSLIYEELLNDSFENQKYIDEAVNNLIAQNIILWISDYKIEKPEKYFIEDSGIPEYYLIPKLFTLHHSILRRL